MQSRVCKNKATVAAGLCVAAFISLLLAGCRSSHSTVSERVLEGGQYAHRIRLPYAFDLANDAPNGFYYNHFEFRLSSSEHLLITASGEANGKKLHSPTVFLLDAAHEYAVQPATETDWLRASNVSVFDALSVTASNVVAPLSGDGNLRIGIDQQAAPGRFTVTAADAVTGARWASVELNCTTATAECLKSVTVLKRRWIAVNVDRSMGEILIWDFKRAPGFSASN